MLKSFAPTTGVGEKGGAAKMAAAQHWDAAWASVWPKIWVVASTATLLRILALASTGPAASMVPGTELRVQNRKGLEAGKDLMSELGV